MIKIQNLKFEKTLQIVANWFEEEGWFSKSNVDKLDVDKPKNLPSNLINLESKVDKLDVDKLIPAPVNLSKLSHKTK